MLVLKCLNFVKSSSLLIVTHRPIMKLGFGLGIMPYQNTFWKVLYFFLFDLFSIMWFNFVYLKLFCNGGQFLKSGAYVHSRPPTTRAPNIPCPPTHLISLNLGISQHPFVSLGGSTDLSSTSSPMQTTNHPLVTPLFLTNHAPPTSAPYHPPPFMWMKDPKLTFSQTFLIMQLTFSPSHSIGPYNWPWSYPPNLPPFIQHILNLHLKYYLPHVSANLLVEG
jgi:hypothetical protein